MYSSPIDSNLPHIIPDVPIEFVLFGLTLTGVAVFHHHTLAVAVSGLAVIIAYQLLFSAFPAGPGINGLLTHLSHEWVVIANLADRKSVV